MTSDPESPDSFVVVAVDGGAASGKSSTSRKIAERRNLLHVDTGSHYRAVTLACLRAGVAPEDSPRLHAFLDSLDLTSLVRNRESRVCFNGNPPLDNAELRSEEVNGQVSPFAALPVVRSAVKAYQRSQLALARKSGFCGVIMDGRDIGTVILPDAHLKIFLVADARTREKRRAMEGASDTIVTRDRTDSTRAVAPLKPAPDAVVIDNSALSLDAVVEKIEDLLDERISCH